jgi:hypothetical protein
MGSSGTRLHLCMVSSREGIDGESAPGPPAVIIGCLEGENPPTGCYAIAVCGLNAASAETNIPKGNAAQARTPIGPINFGPVLGLALPGKQGVSYPVSVRPYFTRESTTSRELTTVGEQGGQAQFVLPFGRTREP